MRYSCLLCFSFFVFFFKLNQINPTPVTSKFISMCCDYKCSTENIYLYQVKATSSYNGIHTDGNRQMPMDLLTLSSSLPSAGDCQEVGQPRNASKAIMPAPNNWNSYQINTWIIPCLEKGDVTEGRSKKEILACRNYK